MKLMRLAMCVAVFALIGGIALSEDLDVRALQAKLAAQEARLNDLQAKMDSVAKGSPKQTEGVLSVRKNAVVTVGGQLNTRYRFHDNKVKSNINAGGTAGLGGRTERNNTRYGNLAISHARLTTSFQANDYFDGFLQVDLHHNDGTSGRISNVAGVAQKYWVRWKNICNSGFGVLIGRNDLIFTDRQALGVYTGYAGGADFAGMFASSNITFTGGNTLAQGGISKGNTYAGEGMFSGREALMPAHTGWDYSRTLQVNPYWESKDKKLRLDASLFQGFDRLEGTTNLNSGNNPYVGTSPDGIARRRSLNYGLGSGSLRVMWKPISGLTLQASVINFYQNFSRVSGNTDKVWLPGKEGRKAPVIADSHRVSHNNTATNVSFWYTPDAFKRLTVFGKWTHGWNEWWMKDLDSDTFQFGLGFKLTEKISWFGTFNYLYSKNGHEDVETWYKGNLWGIYTGFRYVLPYGVDVELGYQYDQATYKDRWGNKHTKATGHSAYAHLGFRF